MSLQTLRAVSGRERHVHHDFVVASASLGLTCNEVTGLKNLFTECRQVAAVVEEDICHRGAIDYLLAVRKVFVPIADVVLIEVELCRSTIRVGRLRAVPSVLA